jgi:hypothetical protein
MRALCMCLVTSHHRCIIRHDMERNRSRNLLVWLTGDNKAPRDRYTHLHKTRIYPSGGIIHSYIRMRARSATYSIFTRSIISCYNYTSIYMRSAKNTPYCLDHDSCVCVPVAKENYGTCQQSQFWTRRIIRRRHSKSENGGAMRLQLR